MPDFQGDRSGPRSQNSPATVARFLTATSGGIDGGHQRSVFLVQPIGNQPVEHGVLVPGKTGVSKCILHRRQILCRDPHGNGAHECAAFLQSVGFICHCKRFECRRQQRAGGRVADGRQAVSNQNNKGGQGWKSVDRDGVVTLFEYNDKGGRRCRI